MRRLAIVMAALALAGCDIKLKPGAETFFDAFDTLPTPAEMVAQAGDRFDANNRYIGTLGLATQNFASEPVYIALFVRNLGDEDPSVRAAAARGLANHGEPSHVGLLVKALKDTDPNVRLEAARGLQRLHGDEAVGPLIDAATLPRDRRTPGASEVDAEVRAQAAHALGQYAEVRVLYTLIGAIDDPDLAVNRAALASLRTLTGQDFGLDRPAWVDWMERTEGTDRFAARTLYLYPVFWRPYRWYEHLPLVPKPPNEAAGSPTGLGRE